MFIPVSKGHYVKGDAVLAIFPAHTSPAIKLRDGARKDGRLVNLKGGRVRIKSMLVMDNSTIVLTSVTPEKFVAMCHQREGKEVPLIAKSSVYDIEDVENSDIILESHITTDLSLEE